MHCDLEPGEAFWQVIVFQAWELVHFVQQKINGGTFNLEQWVEQILESVLLLFILTRMLCMLNFRSFITAEETEGIAEDMLWILLYSVWMTGS